MISPKWGVSYRSRKRGQQRCHRMLFRDASVVFLTWVEICFALALSYCGAGQRRHRVFFGYSIETLIKGLSAFLRPYAGAAILSRPGGEVGSESGR